MKAKDSKNNYSSLKNKLVLVPAGLLIGLLSFVGGTQYESQVKDILNQPPVQQTSRTNFPSQAKVSRVVDGDTVVLDDGTIVRYLGITAPETGEPLEEEATEANEKLTKNKTVKLEYESYTGDKFGRLLAYVFVKNKNVSLELVKKGLAKVVILQKRKPSIYQDQLLKAQDEAKQKKLGIWSE